MEGVGDLHSEEAEERGQGFAEDLVEELDGEKSVF